MCRVTGGPVSRSYVLASSEVEAMRELLVTSRMLSPTYVAPRSDMAGWEVAMPRRRSRARDLYRGLV